MTNKIILGTIIAIAFVLLIPVPIFAPSHPEFSEQKCEELEVDRKKLQKYYQTYEVAQDEELRIEVLGQIKELTNQIKEFCIEPEPICEDETVFVDGICQEVSQSVRTKANQLCQDALDSHHESQKYGGSQFAFNYQDCMEEKIKAILSKSEPEPVKTADDQYKIICSAPDGYCMSKVGMNNPEAYGACLERWIPFCQTYEAKQTPVTNLDILCGKGTIEKNGQCVVDTSKQLESKSFKGGGCLIATVTYGSELSSQVQQLRERDNKLQTESGTLFINNFNLIYYSFSPIIADYERENPVFREMVKIAITPMISSLSILNHVEMSSDQEVLVYGISLILLNAGMYVGIPAVMIIGIRKKFQLQTIDQSHN